MARQSSSKSTTRRSTASSNKPNSTKNIANASSKMPPATMHQQSGTIVGNAQPQGFLARVAETATGVAIGHVMGRVITGAATSMFGGGPSSVEHADASADTSAAMPSSTWSMHDPSVNVPNCQPHLAQFLTCMDRNNQDSSSCQFYLDLLSQCRSSSSHTRAQDSATF